MLRNTIAALAVASIVVLATPVAASAASPSASCGIGSDSYAVASVVTSSDYVIEPGDSVDVTWQDGYFAPGSSVTVVTSGSAASGSQVETSGVSTANGSLTASVTVATDVSGSLSVAGMSDSACGGVTVQVAGEVERAAVADSSLAATGSTVPTVLLVSGAGALAFGIILLVARFRLRRHGQE